MKTKLLKKIRSRYEMTYDPNIESGSPYKITLRHKKFSDKTISMRYDTKEHMFERYRESVIFQCGNIYGCYKRKKTIQIIKHCEL